MDERTKKALSRTRENAVRMLEDINDTVERNWGGIDRHMVLDDMKDAVKIVCKIESAEKTA